MPNNKTLHKAIERANKKITTKSKALPFIKTIKGRNKCLEAIKVLENKILTLEQQLKYNYLRREHERDKTNKGAEQLHPS